MKTLDSLFKKKTNGEDLKKECSKLFYEASKKTWENRKGKIGEIQTSYDSFSGFRSIDVSGLKNSVAGMGSDGIGTKHLIAEMISHYLGNSSFHMGLMKDLFAMVCDDAVVRGAEPIILNWTINFNVPNKEVAKFLAWGSVDAAKLARVSIFSGETASLGGVVEGIGNKRYLTDATVFWIANKNRIIDGKAVKEGDKLIAFREEGFRSNGLTKVREIARKNFGNKWYKEKLNGKSIAELALTPSKIYCPAIVDMFGGYNTKPKANIHAVANITGGGIPEKMKRALEPSGLGAILYNLFEPPEITKFFQKVGRIGDFDAYHNWNMGNGMVVATDEPNKVISIAKEYNFDVKEAGVIIKKPNLVWKNYGEKNKGEYFSINLK